jgi:hypothetical protein
MQRAFEEGLAGIHPVRPSCRCEPIICFHSANACPERWSPPPRKFRGGQNIRAKIRFGVLRSAVSPLPLTPSPTRREGADRKDVRHDHEPLWDATRVRRSHPAPILGLGADRKDVRNNQGPLSAATNARPSHPAPACVRAKTGIPTPRTPNSPTCSVRP